MHGRKTKFDGSGSVTLTRRSDLATCRHTAKLRTDRMADRCVGSLKNFVRRFLRPTVSPDVHSLAAVSTRGRWGRFTVLATVPQSVAAQGGTASALRRRSPHVSLGGRGHRRPLRRGGSDVVPYEAPYSMTSAGALEHTGRQKESPRRNVGAFRREPSCGISRRTADAHNGMNDASDQGAAMKNPDPGSSRLISDGARAVVAPKGPKPPRPPRPTSMPSSTPP
jgi:hypothetical protein